MKHKQDVHLRGEHPVKQRGGGCEEAISRILFPWRLSPRGGQSSIWDSSYLLPLATNPEVDRRAACKERSRVALQCDLCSYPSCLVLLQMGFTRPASHPAAGELLPHHFTLTRRSDGCRRQAVCFCGTFLQVALTGRYPASCSVEFGLSSNCYGTPCSPRLPVFLTFTPPRVAYIRCRVQSC
jgi:hypothetical protein